MGFKALLYSSYNFYEVLYECRNECLSRMEFSETLESVKQEMDFFNEGLVSDINELHIDTLNRVNGNDDTMDLIYKRATIEEVMD
jgi:hypothetical protein